MPRKILLLQGRPDASAAHFGDSLAASYARGAQAAGHEIRQIRIAELDFPLLRSKSAWDTEAPPPVLQRAQDAIRWAEHIVFFFPLWLGGMPAIAKGFLEQVLRPGFAIERAPTGSMGVKLLTGRSARIVVTMGMPSLVYRWYFRAHSLKALERNILGFVGIAPIHETLVGTVEGMKQALREQWVRRFEAMGREGR
ncbi:MAG: flavodoxin family protein [Comamonadaceae bacterium]|nr:MAG: flavodoxin family protein [Comamonadaceae bacterium]